MRSGILVHNSLTLRTLLRGDPPKDVVMLTATPVNNSLWDLYYLLNYFIKNDAAFANEGIRSLRERFKTAQSEDPADLARICCSMCSTKQPSDGLGGSSKITTRTRRCPMVKEEVRVNFPDPKPKACRLYILGDVW